jgi:hypothetical protein
MNIGQSSILAILNQIFEVEKKVSNSPFENKLERNLNRIKSTLEEIGYKYHNPIGERYQITRLDCEAMVAGDHSDNLRIVEVIKPIIYFQQDGRNQIVQKAVVITETSNEN